MSVKLVLKEREIKRGKLRLESGRSTCGAAKGSIVYKATTLIEFVRNCNGTDRVSASNFHFRLFYQNKNVQFKI